MSNHLIIKALQDELEKEKRKLQMELWLSPQHQTGIKIGHEAATARLLGLLTMAVEMAEFYRLKSNYIVRDEGRNYDTNNVVYELDEDTYDDVELGTKAREFLTTLADASGESGKENE